MSTPPASPVNESPSRSGRNRSWGRWVIAITLSAPLVFMAVLVYIVFMASLGVSGRLPIDVAAARYTPKDIVGDLGGMPVRIDRHVVHFVEYDGDPSWGEKRQGPVPERTYASPLVAFGFHVRYPDLGSLAEPEMRKDFDRYHHPGKNPLPAELRNKNPWIDGGVSSGSHYTGHGSMNRLYEGTIPQAQPQPEDRRLQPMPSPWRNLEMFVPKGIDPASGVPFRFKSGGGDTYFHRTPQGKVTTHINCSHLKMTRQYAVCQQTWSMEDHGLKINVRALYEPYWLPQWQDIQDKVSQYILSWRAPNAKAEAKQAQGLNLTRHPPSANRMDIGVSK